MEKILKIDTKFIFLEGRFKKNFHKDDILWDCGFGGKSSSSSKNFLKNFGKYIE